MQIIMPLSTNWRNEGHVTNKRLPNKMATSSDERTLYVEIRKLRKKLRQIDNLKRLDRPLVPEEEDKVGKASSIRCLLQEKLEEYSALEEADISGTSFRSQNGDGGDASQNSHNLEDGGRTEEGLNDVSLENSDKMKRPYSEEVAEETDKIGRENNMRKDSKSPPKVPKQETGSREEEGQSKTAAAGEGISQSTKVRSKSNRRSPEPGQSAGWGRIKFTVRDLEGHNDMVCAVSCCGSRLLTGSRDTMVKYWDLDSGTELRSMGAHSGTVTSVILLSLDDSTQIDSELNLTPSAHIGVTGSKDCYIKVWSLDSGQAVHSIYTYNPVECLGYMPQWSLIVSGSDGGKVELWDIKTGKNVFSTIGHDDAVTCIQVVNMDVYTSCSDGTVKLWRLRDQSLHVTFVSENISSKSSSRLLAKRHIRSLAVSGDTFYYGDDGLNVKALEWRKGLVHKLKNHTGDFGSTDSMCSTKDLLMCSGYNLDTGCGYLNVWSLPEEVYLATIGDRDISRIVAMDFTETKEGALRIVTGGQELRVWDKIPNKRYSPQDAIPTEFNCIFTFKAQDSDADSDTSDSDGDIGQERRYRWRQSKESEESSKGSSWSSWCCLV